MEETKPELKWVPLYLAYDEFKDTVKMKTDTKEDFPIACGLLMRLTQNAVKDILISEADKSRREYEREVKNDELSDSNE